MKDKWILLKNFILVIWEEKNGYIGEFLRHREVAKFFPVREQLLLLIVAKRTVLRVFCGVRNLSRNLQISEKYSILQ